FFFQAEDGIRDFHVTGVQTCALPISGHPSRELTVLGVTGTDGKTTTSALARHLLRSAGRPTGLLSTIGYELPDGVLRQPPTHFKIGRASCRERVKMPDVALPLSKRAQ